MLVLRAQCGTLLTCIRQKPAASVKKRTSTGRKAQCKQCKSVEWAEQRASSRVPKKHPPVRIDTVAETKSCSKCSQIQPFSEFVKDRNNRTGLTSWCRSCYSVLKKSEYQKQQKRYVEYARDYRESNPDKVKGFNTSYRAANPEKVKASMRRWREKNPDSSANYRASMSLRTPPWLTEEQLGEIKTIYIECPVGYHVDHIIPLHGKTVCGLHVPWNLQHLPAEENLAKGNKLLEGING